MPRRTLSSTTSRPLPWLIGRSFDCTSTSLFAVSGREVRELILTLHMLIGMRDQKDGLFDTCLQASPTYLTISWAYYKRDTCESEEKTMNRKQRGSWDMTQHPPMPRPTDDDGYFEQMSKVVFRAGLNWSVIEKKWPDIKRAMANFSIDAVAQFDADDIDRLLKDDGMIRSAKKIAGVIGNARAVQKIQQDFGSFPKYLQAVKANGEEALLKDLRKRFAFLGESSSVMFLFAVGEEMPQTLEKMQGAAQ